MRFKVFFSVILFSSTAICWSQTRTLPVDTTVTTKHKLTTQTNSLIIQLLQEHNLFGMKMVILSLVYIIPITPKTM